MSYIPTAFRLPQQMWVWALMATFACDSAKPTLPSDQDSADPATLTPTTDLTTPPGNTLTSMPSTTATDSMCANGPLSQPIANCAPPTPPSTGDFAQDCVDRINQLRYQCQCLPPLARWTEAETCTDQQSADDHNDGGHANFGACGESAQNTCPDWPSTPQVVGGCLQTMWDEGPGEPFTAHGHYINMASQTYTKVACGQSFDGTVWSNQNFAL